MESPKHCLICGCEIDFGIETHVKYNHGMTYGHYCKYFSKAVGSYSLYKKRNKVVITVTREVIPIKE